MTMLAENALAPNPAITLGGYRWRLAETQEIEQINRASDVVVRRPWRVELTPRQNADPGREAEFPLIDFSAGYGHSFSDQVGPYEQSRRWTTVAPGKIATWGPLTTAEMVSDIDARGHLFYKAPYLYMARGQYVVKYQPNDLADVEWEVLEYHYIGDDRKVKGRPAEFKGKVYIPVEIISTGEEWVWVELVTVSTPVTEVQVLTQSGTPTGGTFSIDFDVGFDSVTEVTFDWDETAASMQSKIRAQVPGGQKVTVERSGASDFVWTLTLTAYPADEGTTSPAQVALNDNSLTGGTTPTVTPSTSVAGTGDQFARGDATTESRYFWQWNKPQVGPVLVRAEDNGVAVVSGDPQTPGDWGAAATVGDSTYGVTALATLGRYLIVGRPDGIGTFDEQSIFVPEEIGVEAMVDDEAFVNMRAFGGWIFAPHATGLIRWRPGAYGYVGAAQQNRLEGERSVGFGRAMGLAPYGHILYYVINDFYNGKSVLCSLHPSGGGFIPHMHDHLTGAVEDVAICQVSSQPAQALTLATLSNDAAVGSNAWSNPTNAQTSDDSRASVATNGQTNYLKALDNSVNGAAIPVGATIDGIKVDIERRVVVDETDNSGATSPATLASAGGGDLAWSNPSNAAASDDSRASASGAGEITEYLRATNFGFAIPTNATIAGIEVGVERRVVENATPHVDFVQARGSGGVTSDLTIAMPVNTQAGDVCLMTLVRSTFEIGSVTYDPTADGWTQLAGTSWDYGGGNTYAVTIYFKRWALGETISSTRLASQGSSPRYAAVAAYRGARTYGTVSALSSNTTIPTISANSGDRIVNLGGGSGAGLNPDATWTERIDGSTTNAGCWIADYETSGSGTTDAGPHTSVAGARHFVVQLVPYSEAVDQAVQLINGGSLDGDDKANVNDWPTTEATRTYGSSSDLWGLSLTPAIVNASDFGVGIAVQVADEHDAEIDHITITVYYKDIDVYDSVVRLVKGGSVSGDNKATATKWPSVDAVASYGGSTDLWGLSWTRDDIIASDFGVVLSAQVDAGQAEVDAISITVYATSAGSGESTPFLAVLNTNSAKDEATPYIYKLPLAGQEPVNDPFVSGAVEDAEFKTPRYYSPSRIIEKRYRACELYLEADPDTNTPGVEVWASVDDGTEFQLLDAAGAAATLSTDGSYELFFPTTSAAVGHWAQLIFKVPTTSGEEVKGSFAVRDIALRLDYFPKQTELITTALVLEPEETFSDYSADMRTPEQQKSDLLNFMQPSEESGPSAALALIDPYGVSGYCTVHRVEIVEFELDERPYFGAVLQLRRAAYA